MAAKRKGSSSEGVVIKPIGIFGGIDNIHIALGILVVILVMILLALSYSKPQVLVTNFTNQSSLHNASEAIRAASQFLASYAYVNTSISLVPYFTMANNATASYIPTQKEWLVTMQSQNPITKAIFNITLLVSDYNLSSITPFFHARDSAFRPREQCDCASVA